MDKKIENMRLANKKPVTDTDLVRAPRLMMHSSPGRWALRVWGTKFTNEEITFFGR